MNERPYENPERPFYITAKGLSSGGYAARAWDGYRGPPVPNSFRKREDAEEVMDLLLVL